MAKFQGNRVKRIEAPVYYVHCGCIYTLFHWQFRHNRALCWHHIPAIRLPLMFKVICFSATRLLCRKSCLRSTCVQYAGCHWQHDLLVRRRIFRIQEFYFPLELHTIQRSSKIYCLSCFYVAPPSGLYLTSFMEHRLLGSYGRLVQVRGLLLHKRLAFVSRPA